ncbi:hypothetical protein P175DRAFT_0530003 [Aspergillus ochraceoroseus IBT 24754]|uniref:Transmembrane protein n=1 Tax=Aspergillus ochraceoroseus IBT 24754 TaxID=1392256 RepID=A0A2T5M325_9EURO|nr:uncharacterized protein P175DRAFT_0530003 [Aspergillus ochraceoroseus IBT 24754]PTU22919.1 hypothetical protein P175DRAFT_0530003 [Aspergillus ochraceoroseus IBT 24754]
MAKLKPDVPSSKHSYRLSTICLSFHRPISTCSVAIPLLPCIVEYLYTSIDMHAQRKTSLIVVLLVLVPIFLAGGLFALAIGCAAFWSSKRFTTFSPWYRLRHQHGKEEAVTPDHQTNAVEGDSNGLDGQEPVREVEQV